MQQNLSIVKLNTCVECKSTDLIVNTIEGTLVCANCGLVQAKEIVIEGAGYDKARQNAQGITNHLLSNSNIATKKLVTTKQTEYLANVDKKLTSYTHSDKKLIQASELY